MKSIGLAGSAAVALLVVVGGCSSSTTSASTTTSSPSSTAAPLPYQHPGPDPVGVTTLDLGSAGPVFGERLATVYYPADPSTVGGHPPFSYTEASTLPTALQGILPAKYNTTATLAAYSEAPASTMGPYPVVLFSHGYGGERLYYSNLLVGIASWGYVVVSADYLERGLAAQALGSKVMPTAATDSGIMQSSLTATLAASGSATSVLRGVADPNRVAAVGHSAGGQTAFDALNRPRVSTAIGWAPEGPAGKPSGKPVMLIGAEGDQVVPPASVKRTYNSFPGPKSLVEISGEGHNTYTDICVGIRQGGGLISYAVASHLVSAKLAKLGINGCQSSDLPAAQFWPIVQFYTVFQLQDQFGGKGRSTVPTPRPGQFPGFTVTVTQQS